MAEDRLIQVDENPDESYTNSTPMPATVGGWDIGSTFNAKTMSEMWTGLLYAYQTPAFSTFTISGQTTPLEVGASIAANRTFTWTTTNPSNINANSLVIRDVTGSTDIATGLANDGSEATTYGAIQKVTATTNQFSITGTNSKSATFTKTYTVTWQWKRFYGESTSTTLNEAAIEALRVGELSSGFAGTYSFVAGGYKYISYNSVLGTATTFKDTSTNLDIPMEAVYTVSVTNAYGVVATYNVHRTTNVMGSAINILVS